MALAVSVFGGPALTLDELRDRMHQAAYTLRRLPMPQRGLPQGFQTTWPDIVRDFWGAYGREPARAPRTAPTPAEVSRLDEVLNWLHLLTRDQRVVTWARATGWTWRRIEALDEMERNGNGRGERRLRSILGDAEARILAHLNGTPPRMVVSLEAA